MKINHINIKLPTKEESIKKFYYNCEERKKLIKDTKDHYKSHLKKAKHDLSRAISEFEDDCWDWSVVMAYYSIHHAGNSLLSKKKGLFSKDHSCLIIALKHFELINTSLFQELSHLHKKFSDILSLDLTFQLRKISQYSIDEWEEITEEDAKLMLDIAKRFINFVEGSL